MRTPTRTRLPQVAPSCSPIWIQRHLYQSGIRGVTYIPSIGGATFSSRKPVATPISRHPQVAPPVAAGSARRHRRRDTDDRLCRGHGARGDCRKACRLALQLLRWEVQLSWLAASLGDLILHNVTCRSRRGECLFVHILSHRPITTPEIEKQLKRGYISLLHFLSFSKLKSRKQIARLLMLAPGPHLGMFPGFSHIVALDPYLC